VKILTHILARFRELLLLCLYIIISFFLMISSDRLIVEGLRSTTLFSIGLVQRQIDAIGSYFYLRSENRQLIVENTRLAFEKYRLQNALLENIRLKKLLRLKDDPAYDFIPARIVGSAPHDFVSGYILSASSGKTITKNSVVITSEGLVGLVVKISGDFAICQMLFDPGSRVSVRIQRNRELGMLAWDGGNGLIIDNVPNTVTVLPGDVALTSGMSQIYPADIKVGVVTEVHKNFEKLFQSIKIRPAVNLNALEEVIILQAR
jgi:rod shape-determining protein MreC